MREENPKPTDKEQDEMADVKAFMESLLGDPAEEEKECAKDGFRLGSNKPSLADNALKWILEEILFVLQKSRLKANYQPPKRPYDIIMGDLSPQVKREFKDKFLSKDWDYFLQLKLLQTPPPNTSRVARQAWDFDFRGNNHDLLRQYITTWAKNRDRFSKDKTFLTILQSSGTGKSRTIDEVAKTIFTLPFCLRDRRNPSAYPTPDRNVTEFFTLTLIKIYDECQVLFLYFLTGMFRMVLDHLKANFANVSGETFSLEWHHYVHFRNSNRAEIHEAAVNYATSKFKEELGPYTSLSDLHKGGYIQPPLPEDISKGLKAVEEAKRLAKEAAGELLKMICVRTGAQFLLDAKGCQAPRDVISLLLYFDEADCLHDIRLFRFWHGDMSHEVRTGHDCLLEVIDELKPFNIFTLFSSTTSSLHQSTPPCRVWCAPFTELPFDLGDPNHTLHFLVKEGDKTLGEMCQLSFMARFGRPLFASNAKFSKPQELIKFVQGKIRFGTKNSITYANGELAAVSIRLLFNFEPSQEAARRTENDLVSSHMRIVFSIREYGMRTGTPSEPILAEAAARIMLNFSGSESLEDSRTKILLKLQEWTSRGLLEKGEVEELVARTLLTFAHDQAVVTGRGGKGCDGTQPIFSSPIGVVAFIEALFSADWAAKILDARPDSGSEPLREAFKNAHIHFTHFARMATGVLVSDKIAFAGICRGMGWVFHRTQRSVDIGIPVFMGGPDDKPVSSKMTMIFFWIKNTVGPQYPLVDMKNFFTTKPEKTPDRMPYIVFVLNLGKRHPLTKPSAHDTDSEAVRSYDVSSSPADVEFPQVKTRVPAPRGGSEGSTVHPKYTIIVHGCSSSVYNILAESHREPCAEILRSQDMLSEHPREGEAFHGAVLQMEPFS